MLTNKLTGAGAAEKTYIEDVFSTYLYTGTGATQTINNGIDLAGKGGMVWVKERNTSVSPNHDLFDTARGVYKALYSNLTSAQAGYDGTVTGFSSTGFTDGAGWGTGTNIASWTFRKAPKFFDVVTYTGNGVAGRQISHNLGSVPGMIIVKSTNISSQWAVFHTSLGGTKGLYLNGTSAAITSAAFWNNTSPTDSSFTISDSEFVNGSGNTFVAYLFAHDTTTDGLIQCGSFTLSGGATTVNLGWEPQFILTKRVDSTSNWIMLDTMRGNAVANGAVANQAYLYPNLTTSEVSSYGEASTTNTGFAVTAGGSTSGTYIYLAIRRGPMKMPTSGTQVYNAIARTGTGAAATVTGVGFAPDLVSVAARNTGTGKFWWIDRLRGGNSLITSGTDAEFFSAGAFPSNPLDLQDGIKVGNASGTNGTNDISFTYINHFFRRAPGVMDVVCYTGTGSARTVNHNLGVVPELMIVKSRSTTGDWVVYSSTIGNTNYLRLNRTNASAADGGSLWNSTSPTASVFSVNDSAFSNQSGATYVAYLFASCPGVSKVGSFTYPGSLIDIDCGFTNGARFVLIKRTDGLSNWFVFDTARGITTSTSDPTLYLNLTAAEASLNFIDPYPQGFRLSGSAPLATNGQYIYLAIA